jgi:hypothetical protein
MSPTPTSWPKLAYLQQTGPGRNPVAVPGAASTAAAGLQAGIAGLQAGMTGMQAGFAGALSQAGPFADSCLNR